MVLPAWLRHGPVAVGVAGMLGAVYGIVVPNAFIDSSALPATPRLVRRVGGMARRMNLPHPERLSIWILPQHINSAATGSTALPSGASLIFGLMALLYEAPAIAMQSNIIMRDAGVPGAAYNVPAELLTPSDGHMDFVIAHELSHVLHHDSLTVNALTYSTAVGSWCGLRRWLARAWLMRTAPMARVGSSFAALAATASATLLMFVGSHWYCELRADRDAVACGPDVARGAKEWIALHLALESLPTSKRRWSLTHPPLTYRLHRICRFIESV